MRAPVFAFAVSTAGFAAVAMLWATGGEVDLPWAPSLDLRLSFGVDALGALFGLLATGVGAAVIAYSAGYLPVHLRHQGRSRREERRFYALLLLFMVSLVGLATARDLILLFAFWELTGIASYFLIGYDRGDARDRRAALMALLVTGVSALLLLIGSLVLAVRYGSFALPDVLARAEPGAATTAAAALIAVAALAKSAQVPLHFWLPRAMVAPTPVSSYLHSAALVAAGVFLLGRFYPLLELDRRLLDGLLVVGMASMAVGGVLALTRDGLKRVLAYSTVAQYGYVVFLLGLGTPAAVAAAWLYVVVHALAKCALFLTAGTVTIATGQNRLSGLGGLRRELPVLAAASGAAAAALVALPPTIGFFADEAFFAAALERGWWAVAAALASAVLTFAYIGRFWAGIFLGRPAAAAERPARALVLPVTAFAFVLAAAGAFPRPLAALAERAAAVSLGQAVELELAYHLDTRAENLLALATYALGAALLATRRLWWPAAVAASALGARLGPERAYTLGLAGLNRISDLIHGFEVRDLRTRVSTVLVPAGLLVLLGVAATPTEGVYRAGTIGGDDIALALVLGVTALAALAATTARAHVTLVLVLSTVGFSLAVAYAFFGGPDVALVAVLVETILALLFLGVFALLPRVVLGREARLPARGSRRWRDPLVGILAGTLVFFVAWGALSTPAPEETVAAELARRTPEAHARDTVTAILADFRGLDTLGEITVLVVALIAIAELLHRRAAP